MKKTSIHLFHSPVSGNESRLLKTCNSIVNLGLVDNVTVLGYRENGLMEDEYITNCFNIHRINCFKGTYKGLKAGILRKTLALLSVIYYQVACIIYCIRNRPTYISCHNAQILHIGVITSFFCGSMLIYEPHELESHKTSLGGIYKFFTKVIEKTCLPFCDKTITVCPPITDFYKKTFKLDDSKIFTIRNIPVNPSIGSKYLRHRLLRDEFSISNEDIIFLYQGVIDDARGINNYLQTFEKLPNKFHLVLMGYGASVEKVKNYERRCPNIHFKDAVAVDEIIKYTSSADVGLFIIPGEISLSYRYSLPNKFFEYAISGLKICISDNFELLSTYITQYKLGDIIKSNEDSLYEYLMKFNENIQYFKNIDADSALDRQNFGWQNEEKEFIKVYTN